MTDRQFYAAEHPDTGETWIYHGRPDEHDQPYALLRRYDVRYLTDEHKAAGDALWAFIVDAVQNDRLAEVKRLREALSTIAGRAVGTLDTDGGDRQYALERVAELATEALSDGAA